MLVCVLKGLVCRERVTPAGSHACSSEALASPVCHGHGCASPFCARFWPTPYGINIPYGWYSTSACMYSGQYTSRTTDIVAEAAKANLMPLPTTQLEHNYQTKDTVILKLHDYCAESEQSCYRRTSTVPGKPCSPSWLRYENRTPQLPSPEMTACCHSTCKACHK